MTQQEHYWKERCEAAEDCINKSPCDPDTTDDLAEAYYKWMHIKIKPPPAPAQGVEEAVYPNEYVCGFLFDKQVQQVVLIWKEKPVWQKDKLNGVGGKIDPGETPYQAMVREFKEETGLQVENWKPLAEVNGDEWRVHFFFAADDCNQFEYAETKETEEVGKIEVDRLDEFECIPNLYWLIPMAVARIKTPGENIIAGSRRQHWQLPAPTCCARWVKASERLPEIGMFVEAWSEPKMDFSSTNITITKFTKYGFEGAANVTHWRKIQEPDEAPAILYAGWMPGTPKLTRPCVFVSKSGPDYSVWTVFDASYTGSVDESYLAIYDGTGKEWGDISDFKCDSYYMLSPYSFPTRDQVEKWLLINTTDDEYPAHAAINLYDWIIEQINKH